MAGWFGPARVASCVRRSDYVAERHLQSGGRARCGGAGGEPACAVAAADLAIGEDVRRELVREGRIVGEIVGVDAVVDDPRWPAGGQASPQIVKPRRDAPAVAGIRSEEHTSELQSLMRISYAVFCLKQKKNNNLTINIK